MVEQPERYCSNCGHELKPEDQFCSNCGMPVHRAARVPIPEADRPVPPLPPPTREVGRRSLTGSGALKGRGRNLVVLLVFGRALALPGASARDREPTRVEAANGIWDTDEARRRGFLELSARTAPGPHRPHPGGNGPGKPARCCSLQRPGGPEGRKGLGAESPCGESLHRDPELLLECGGARDFHHPESSVPWLSGSRSWLLNQSGLC